MKRALGSAPSSPYHHLYANLEPTQPLHRARVACGNLYKAYLHVEGNLNCSVHCHRRLKKSLCTDRSAPLHGVVEA